MAESLENETCVTTTTGTITSILTSTGNFTFIATGKITVGGDSFICDSASYSENTTWQTYGLQGVFVALLLIIALVTIGIWHPIISIMLAIATIVFLTMTGLFHLSWGALVTVIILGGIVLYKLSRSD